MSPPSTITIPIAFVHNMLHGVRARGLSETSFLADAGIADELLSQTGSRVTVAQYIHLFKTIVERLDDDGMGLHSRPLRRGCFALIARSAVSTPTLGVAIHRIARTYRLLQDDVQIQILRDGKQAGFALAFTDNGKQVSDFLHELLLRVFWRLLAWLVGGDLPVTRFTFAFERPLYADSYNRIFPSPQTFDCAHSAFWFDETLLKQRVRQDETSLSSFLKNAQANVILPPRNLNTVSACVRNQLLNTLPQWSNLASTAASLNISSATLQRKLSAEGTSFQALKDALRRDHAIVRLNTSTVSLHELACELAFSDVASFQRAFKGWTGSAPGAYRIMTASH
jgi:AraC-like DNA-binding protein